MSNNTTMLWSIIHTAGTANICAHHGSLPATWYGTSVHTLTWNILILLLLSFLFGVKTFITKVKYHLTYISIHLTS